MLEGRLQLTDGRSISYSECGRPAASAVMYCHGFPGNRRELELIERTLDRCGVDARLIALNRPGYGSSTFQPHRTILDWPADVSEAADQLGIDRFAVLGVSGGGPYALACGYGLPDRVTSIGIVAGIAPIEAPGMDQASSISGPSPHLAIRRLQFALAAFAFRKGQGSRFVDQSVATMGPADQAALAQIDIRSWFTDTLCESFEQGGRAAAHEASLYRREWGFNPGRITVKTRLWYGEADRTVPASAGRWLADRIQGADFSYWPDQGHFTWMLTDHGAEVINSTVGALR
ncbi:MAG: alpha/beta hydrolase [Acidimicrobiia bacterium]